jgi:hypothetical protein
VDSPEGEECKCPLLDLLLSKCSIVRLGGEGRGNSNGESESESTSNSGGADRNDGTLSPSSLHLAFSYAGVTEVLIPVTQTATAAAGQQGVPKMRRFVFEIPKCYRTSILLQTGLPARKTGTSTANASGEGGANSGAESGFIVGYFTTALEAAIVREQVLNLTSRNSAAFGTKSSISNLEIYSEDNFATAEWTELRKIAGVLKKFTTKSCLQFPYR